MTLPPVGKKPSKKTVEKVAKVIRDRFPATSAGHANIVARTIADAPNWAPEFFHTGKDDYDALTGLQGSLRKVELALAAPSHWSQTSLEYFATQDQLRNRLKLSDGCEFRAPMTIEQLKTTLALWMASARQSQELLKQKRTHGGAIWGAVPLVEIARQHWEVLMSPSKKPAPSRGLNPASPFALFLQDILDILELDITANSAFNAWRREVDRPNSLTERPLRES